MPRCINKSAPWALSTSLAKLPSSSPRNQAAAIMVALTSFSSCLLVACYLPQDEAAHKIMCESLSSLPHAYPNHTILVAGEVQRNGHDSSPKSVHIRSMECTRIPGPIKTISYFAHNLLIKVVIDHFVVSDPLARLY
jgi:hypothetical protein